MKTLFKIKLLMAALLVILMAGTAAAQVSLRFEPENSSIDMGESARLGIWLEDAVDVRTIELTVAYDDQILNSIGGGKGAGYEALAGPPPFFEDFDDETVAGQWTAYVVAVGAESYVSGPAELFYWEVEGLSPGLSNISSVQVALYDVAGAAIANVTLNPATMEVMAPIEIPAVVPEPEFTAGSSNMVSWNNVGATEYQIEAAEDAGFAGVVGDSGWIISTSYEFAGLTPGQTYYFRVRARLDSPAYETGWSVESVFSTQDFENPTSVVDPLDLFQTNLSFDIPWTGSDVTSGLSRVELWVDNGSGYSLYDTDHDPESGLPFSFTAAYEGPYSFYTLAYDEVENAEVAPGAADASTTVDVTAPSGDLLVNGGATLINDPAVALTNSIVDAVQMRFTNFDGDFSAIESQWQIFSGTWPWTLTAGDGLKTVYAEFIDEAGNIYETSTVVTLDTTPPAETFVINDDYLLTNNPEVVLTNSGSDAAEMRFTNIDGDWSDPASSWQTYTGSINWTTGSGQGLHTVYGQFRDEVGNVSDENDSITLDTIAPTAILVINDEALLTNDVNVVISSTSVDAFEMQFSNDGSTWSSWSPYSDSTAWVLGSIDGLQTVYGQYRDEAGNLVGTSDSITLDTQAPTAEFVINNNDVLTNDPNVILTSTSADALEMQFSNDESNWSGWVAYDASFAWVLPAGEGLYTVYGQHRDLAGNVTNSEDTITMDTTAPTGVMLVNNGDSMTNNHNVILTNVVTDAAEMQFSNDGTTWPGWSAFNGTLSWTLAAGDGSRTVFGMFQDAAGNILNVQDDITIDSTPPDGSFVINNDEALTNDTDVALVISVFGAVEMRFTNSIGSWVGPESTWQSYAAALAWTLSSGDGNQMVYGQFRDTAGNIFDADDSIILDATAPAVTMVVNNDESITGDTNVMLTLTGSGATEMQFSNNGSSFSGWIPYAASSPWTLGSGDGEHVVYGNFRDAAMNVSLASDSIILDTTAPDIPVLSVEPLFTFGNQNTISWSQISAASYYAETATDPGFTSVSANSDWIPGVEFSFTGLVDGQPYFYRVKARDDLGNETDWSGVVTSTQDASSPVSSTGSLDSHQATLSFPVPWTGSDASSGLVSVELFVNDGAGWVSYDSTTETATPEPFVFNAPTEGTYGFYTVATDGVGLVEAAPGTEDVGTIVDITAPTGGFVINDNDVVTNDPAVVLTVNVLGASQMKFRNAGESWSAFEPYAGTRAWTLAGVDGSALVEAEFQDEAGNFLSADDGIELDTMAPEGILAINNGAAVTSDQAVSLNNDVTGSLDMRFSNNQALWSDWLTFASDYPWILTSGDGTKTVFAEYRDEAGNILAVDDQIDLDTTAPEIPVMMAEPEFTQGLVNLVSWSNIGAANYIAEVASDAGFTSIVGDTGWMVGTSHEFTGLAHGQTYYYRVRARDTMGNESSWSGSVFSTQDNIAPITLVSPMDAFQSNLTFEVPWAGDDDGTGSGLAVVELFVNDGGGWISAGVTSFVDPPEPFAFTASSEGSYEFYVVALDQAGNQESPPAESEAETFVDVTAPLGLLVINDGDETTSDQSVVLTSNITDDSGVSEMRFTNTAEIWPGGPNSWLEYETSYSWILTGGDGLKTIFAEYRDEAGNVLDTSDDITLDTTPPGMPAFVPEPAYTMGTANEVFWIDSDAVAYFVQSAITPGFEDVLTTSGWIGDLAHTFTGLDDGQIYYYRIRARDNQDNETDWGVLTSSTQDATAPVSMAGALGPYQGTPELIIPWTGSDAVSNLAQVELMVNAGSGYVSAGVTTEMTTPVDFVFTVPSAGAYSFYTVATDIAGNLEMAPASADASTMVDLSAPAVASELESNPGYSSITLSWINPDEDDLDEVEIWTSLWVDSGEVSAYPEYDDIAGEPVRPASRAAAAAAPQWVQIATVNPSISTFHHHEGMDDRGIYYYEIFVKDLAGNYSAPAANGTRATNYRLGDLNSDSEINVFDITGLGASYGTEDGADGYNNNVDVGPTDDNSGTGVPVTDNVIDFEDLAVFALNYGQNKSAAEVQGSESPALTWYQVDETTWALGLIEPCSTLKALHLFANLPEGVAVTVERGSALGQNPEYFLANIDRNGLDAGFAVLGNQAVLSVVGEILRITTSRDVDLSSALIVARDKDNQELEFGLSTEPLQVLPAAYRLAHNYPNPFNPITNISFDLPKAQDVRLVVYDLKGRLVSVLVNEALEAGNHSLIWNGTDRNAQRVASGVYFYQIQAGPLKDTKRMLLVK